jgi:hypothetical protein
MRALTRERVATVVALARARIAERLASKRDAEDGRREADREGKGPMAGTEPDHVWMSPEVSTSLRQSRRRAVVYLFETMRVNGTDKVVVCFAASVAVTRKCHAPPRPPHTESDPTPPTAVF